MYILKYKINNRSCFFFGDHTVVLIPFNSHVNPWPLTRLLLGERAEELLYVPPCQIGWKKNAFNTFYGKMQSSGREIVM